MGRNKKNRKKDMAENIAPPEIPKVEEPEAPEGYVKADNHIDALDKESWPPRLQIEEGKEPIQLHELDVSWIYCTVLNMKWGDAQSVTDVLERKFLYNKAMIISQAMVEQQQARANQQAAEQQPPLNL
jgi:hypothetical protein